MNEEREGHKPARRLGVLLAGLAVVGFLAYSGVNIQRARTRSAPLAEVREVRPVSVSRARTMTLTRRLELTGEVRPWQEVHVFAKVPGQIIRRLTVRKGERVKAGQVLARLDEQAIDARLQEARAALAAAEAGIARAEANRALLEKDRLRFEALLRENAVPRQQVDHLRSRQQEADAARNASRAQAEQARAVIRQLSLTREDHRVRAPLDGVVTARCCDPGNLSSTERPLVQLADDSRVKILAFVTEADLPSIRPGIPAEVRIDAYPERRFSGAVSLVNAALSPATRSADIEIHLDNPEGLLRPGMYARVTLVTGATEAVAVDRDAVLRMPGTGSDYVFTVEDHRAVLVNVVTGLRQGRFVALRQGVAPGTAVVVEGQGALHHGDRVRIRPTESRREEGQGG